LKPSKDIIGHFARSFVFSIALQEFASDNSKEPFSQLQMFTSICQSRNWDINIWESLSFM